MDYLCFLTIHKSVREIELEVLSFLGDWFILCFRIVIIIVLLGGSLLLSILLAGGVGVGSAGCGAVSIRIR